MNYMKYIVLDGQYGDAPIIFPDSMEHRAFSQAFDAEVVSAGFVTFGFGKVQCYGQSVSLNVASRSEDSALVARLIGEKDD